MRLKPDCGTLPWLAAALTILGAAGRIFLPTAPAWPSYLFFGLIVMLALIIAYLGWRCHVERQLPAPHIQKLIVHLAEKKGFGGTVAEFNKEAQRVLYDQKYYEYIRESTDYYSLLIANDYIKIVGASKIGQPDSGLYIALTDRAQKLAKKTLQTMIHYSVDLSLRSNGTLRREARLRAPYIYVPMSAF